MAIKIKFIGNQVEVPVLVLAKRSGKQIGKINPVDFRFKDQLNSYSEMNFCVYKDEYSSHIWDEIQDFRLIYCRNFDLWYEIQVSVEEEKGTVYKDIIARSLGEVELSQLNLYGVEINTEDDIARDDYVPTVLYNQNKPEASLLNRLLGEKAPHYSIVHVDSEIANVQRSFSFDDKSIYDALQDVAEAYECLIKIECKSDPFNGGIIRNISAYKMDNYGEDTDIHISTHNLAKSISTSVDTDQTKNCFHIEAGDDEMTAAVRSLTMGGDGYIWFVSDEQKDNMSDALRLRWKDYQDRVAWYLNETKNSEYYKFPKILSGTDNIKEIYKNLSLRLKIKLYSDVAKKYERQIMVGPDSNDNWIYITGYDDLVKCYYDIVDFKLFLESGLMPDVDITEIETTAEDEIAKIPIDRELHVPAEEGDLAGFVVAVDDVSNCSVLTAKNVIESYIKSIVKPTYRVTCYTNTNENGEDVFYTIEAQPGVLTAVWNGSIEVTSYTNSNDTAVEENVWVLIGNNLEQYINDKINNILNQKSEETDIVALFKMSMEDFSDEITKYCLSRLTSFNDACQACMDMMIKMGAPSSSDNAVKSLYNEYQQKELAVDNEVGLRQKEIASVDIALTEVRNEINAVQSALRLQGFMGDELWKEFCALRREDSYKNENYISAGLSNNEILNMAKELIDVATEDLKKSATLQKRVKTKLKNLLVMDDFAKMAKRFEVGNFVRVRSDKTTHKLRLESYEISDQNIEDIDVTFTDVDYKGDSQSDVKNVLSKVGSLASKYSHVSKQMSTNNNGNVQKYSSGDENIPTVNATLFTGGSSNGINLSQQKIFNSTTSSSISIDDNGIICRDFDTITKKFSGRQLKLNNNGIYATDNNWKNVNVSINGNGIVIDENRNVDGRDSKFSLSINNRAVRIEQYASVDLRTYRNTMYESELEADTEIYNYINSQPAQMQAVLRMSDSLRRYVIHLIDGDYVSGFTAEYNDKGLGSSLNCYGLFVRDTMNGQLTTVSPSGIQTPSIITDEIEAGQIRAGSITADECNIEPLTLTFTLGSDNSFRSSTSVSDITDAAKNGRTIIGTNSSSNTSYTIRCDYGYDGSKYSVVLSVPVLSKQWAGNNLSANSSISLQIKSS